MKHDSTHSSAQHQTELFNITPRSLYTRVKDCGTNRTGDGVGFRPRLNVLKTRKILCSRRDSNLGSSSP